MPSLQFETSAIVKRAENVSWTCLDGEAILLDLQSGMYYTLNEVGCAIWQNLDGVRTMKDVGQEICAMYDVEPPQAEHDILAVCGDLYQEQLVSRVTQRPHPCPSPKGEGEEAPGVFQPPPLPLERGESAERLPTSPSPFGEGD